MKMEHGNAGAGNTKGQKMREGGKGAKAHNDMMSKKMDMSKSMGGAGMGKQHKADEKSCHPEGQKMMG